jgi:23S rRNA (guanosine2251-2'-O)-methyltransferase
VKETLSKGILKINEIWLAEGKDSVRIREIVLLANKKDIPVYYRESKVLDNLIPYKIHRGMIAFTEKFRYSTLDDLIYISSADINNALIIVADHITDEGNLGALIRSAAFFGAQGLVLPKDRSAAITERVMKRSSGAYLHLPVTRIVNIGRTLDVLIKKGFWIIGTAGDASESIYNFDWNRPLALIMGNEEKGLSHSVRKRCHQYVQIPGSGKVESLNVSVACGIILSEIIRQRG